MLNPAFSKLWHSVETDISSLSRWRLESFDSSRGVIRLSGLPDTGIGQRCTIELCIDNPLHLVSNPNRMCSQERGRTEVWAELFWAQRKHASEGRQRWLVPVKTSVPGLRKLPDRHSNSVARSSVALLWRAMPGHWSWAILRGKSSVPRVMAGRPQIWVAKHLGFHRSRKTRGHAELLLPPFCVWNSGTDPILGLRHQESGSITDLSCSEVVPAMLQLEGTCTGGHSLPTERQQQVWKDQQR